ncbi:hypothetical protein D0T49_03180 [Paludibacter sp. 221]|uniref:hypothetical protein n=1 Tax=Paludibacter sp. 221 TaxID=2302939 RepID=UPI0013D508F4|nr:hypothetical protein [Paludibacter sp. 221]NDV46043.1 hypothetical protein [Paludibacter sp. 221]
MKDFTLSAYRNLLIALKEKGYFFFTFEDWCEGKANGKYIILRHDVDLKVENSFETAKIENSLNIRATYYFRIVPQSNKPEYIRKIAELGHEIAYHYEDLAITQGNVDEGMKHFEKQLQYFRQFYPVVTVCMHGSPTSKYDNRTLWTKYSYKDYGIIGEPYFDFLNEEKGGNVLYFTDTARMWDGDKYNVRDKRIDSSKSVQPIIHTTFDFIDWIEKSDNQLPIMITTHPQRWTDNKLEWTVELFSQSIKNKIKQLFFANK